MSTYRQELVQALRKAVSLSDELCQDRVTDLLIDFMAKQHEAPQHDLGARLDELEASFQVFIAAISLLLNNLLEPDDTHGNAE